MVVSENDDVICGVPLGPRVVEAFPSADHTLYLTFNNGEKRVFDAKPLLSMRVFQPLGNDEFFASVKVNCGTIVWPRDIDYCPDTLYSESIPVETTH